MHLGPPVGKSAHGDVGQRIFLMSPREEPISCDKVYIIIVVYPNWRSIFKYL